MYHRSTPALSSYNRLESIYQLLYLTVCFHQYVGYGAWFKGVKARIHSPKLIWEETLTGQQGRKTKLGVQFLGLGYYYPSTEKKLDRSTQFGAVGYIITLYSSKRY